jgi:hypothetical protein
MAIAAPLASVMIHYVAVKPRAHLLAGLEEGNHFLLDHDPRARARIAADTGRTVPNRENSKATQLHAIAARHRRNDLAENGIDDLIHVTLVEMWVLCRDALN